MFSIRVKYITRLWVRTIRPAMKLRDGYPSPDYQVNRSHLIKYLPVRRCSSTWIGSGRFAKARGCNEHASRLRIRDRIGARASSCGGAKRDGALDAPHCGRGDTQGDRNGATGKHSRGTSADSSIAAARYIHYCYQADKDHNWTEGRDNSARNKGSAGGASGGHGSSAIQGRIDVCKNILNGFEVTPANP